MKADIPEIIFETRADFRKWLSEIQETGTGDAKKNKTESGGANSDNAATGGVWLVFGKTKNFKTFSANDALEEALCFGWIDGQMKSVDETKYLKYFARRRPKSVWSDKNKKLIESLRERGLMTEAGEATVCAAMKNGTWDTPKGEPISETHIAALTEKLTGKSPAYENFLNMPPSVKKTYAGRYFSFKTEDARERDFLKIVERLNNNLKPM